MDTFWGGRGGKGGKGGNGVRGGEWVGEEEEKVGREGGRERRGMLVRGGGGGEWGKCGSMEGDFFCFGRWINEKLDEYSAWNL